MPPHDSAGRRGAIARLIDSFADLPGIGRKSAERLAHHVLQMPPAEALAFADAIREVKQNLRLSRLLQPRGGRTVRRLLRFAAGPGAPVRGRTGA